MRLRDLIRRPRRRLPVPFLGGNRVKVLFDGAAYFGELLEAIQRAERYLFVETYILAADPTGWRVAHALAARARAGVEVCLCYDGYGSLSLEQALPDFLRAAGVKVLVFRPVSPWRGVWPWTKRNHRKVLVADGRVGIVGGQNLSEDYAPVEDGGKNWRDTAVRVEGPAVAQLEVLFRDLWLRFGGAPLVTPRGDPPAFPAGHQVRFLGSFGRRDRSYIRRAYSQAILGAERSIQISNAYFAPDRGFERLLRRAARRGVRVELLIGAATDVRAVLHVSRSLYARLLAAGVEVHEWSERVLHAKTAVIDGSWSTVGSSNLDNLSQFRNYEINAEILGEPVGQALADQFEVDRARSRRISPAHWARRSWWQRLVEWFFGRFRRHL